MKEYEISIIKGDGIGEEIMNEAIKILDSVGEYFGFELNYNYVPFGGSCIDVFNKPIVDETIDIIRNSQALLLGPIGGKKWSHLPEHLKPENALIKLREEFKIFSVIRPIKMYDEFLNYSYLKNSIIKNLDVVVIRDLAGGIYFSHPKSRTSNSATDTLTYTENEIKRVAKIAFDIAKDRKKKVTLIDKANILESSMFWREVVSEVAKDYKDVTLEFMYLSDAVMNIIKKPTKFDVLLTESLFGNVICDELSIITGTLPLIASANFGESINFYQPAHKSALNIAHQGIADPSAMILSAAMMLKYSFNEIKAYECIKKALLNVIKDGYRTNEFADEMTLNEQLCNTSEFGGVVSDYIIKSLR